LACVAAVFLRALDADFGVAAFRTGFLPAVEAAFREEVFVAVTFFRDTCFAVDLRVEVFAFRLAVRPAEGRVVFLRDADFLVDAAALLDLP